MQDQQTTWKYINKLTKFNPKTVLDHAWAMLEGDEPLRAIEVLENIPAYFRDNVPPEIQELKDKIRGHIMLQADYQVNPYDRFCTVERGVQVTQAFPRGQVMLNLMKEYNDRSLVPHIVDMGPGDYWLPQGLLGLGHKFTYEPWGVHLASHEAARQALATVLPPSVLEPIPPTETLISWKKRYASFSQGRPVIFVAYEIIEHLIDTSEIRMVYDRIPGPKHHVMLSTPMYDYDLSRVFEDQTGLGHVRAYTPKEFMLESAKLFPEYNWQYVPADAMVMKGDR